ncbi:MAG: TonB-dependent receptor [Betaproteobacteria bacterium]|nr:TonB-dependent receptor [Betaproteobacteria bacterium]
MKPTPLAGLAAAAALVAQAQSPADFPSYDSRSATAARAERSAVDALRDVIVIPRDRIEQSGSLSLAELLQRHAGVEFRGAGGPGQPAGLFLRGANAGQTLVLVDGLRVGSATVGTTSIENIPLDLVERIEVVKGPLSSLYGADAIGGVVQVFTRAGAKPRVFASVGAGNAGEYRAAAGFTAIEKDVTYSFSAGARKADAPSATNERAACHDPDRDPHENAFASAQVAWRWWQGEDITIAGFTSQGKTHFDGCPDAQGRFGDDRNDQAISGARITSRSWFAPWWASRLTLGQGRDKLEIRGSEPGHFETRQDQISWVNEFGTVLGPILLGAESVRQQVESDTAFSRNRRDTNSVFVSVNETWQGQRLEASARRDEDEQFGGRNTGTLSYGAPWPGFGFLTFTTGRGFRAPTFFDLYAPPSDSYRPNPDLRPERSESREISLRTEPGGKWSGRLTWFDHRLEDLITYAAPTMQNVNRARIKGMEASIEGFAGPVKVRGSLSVQQPRDEETGYRLQGRAERFGRLELEHVSGPWRITGGVTASGDRFDSTHEAAGTRLPGYATFDAVLRYRIDGNTAIEFSGANLADKRLEHAIGYDAPRRAFLLRFTFEGK